MERWTGKVAIVTGASAGIGAAIVESLVNYDLKVVGLSRRKEILDKMAENFKDKQFYGIKTDITKEEDILNAFKWVKENLGPISILINNAGIVKNATLIDGATSDFRSTLDTNVIGLTIATREAVQDMRTNNIDGHIIHINSITGHYITGTPSLNIYPASKYAVTALTETLKMELKAIGSKIKVTSISPGFVKTEISTANGFFDDNKAKEMFEYRPCLHSKDIADAVAYVLATSSHVQYDLEQLKTDLEQMKTQLELAKTDLKQMKADLVQMKTDLGQTKTDFEQMKPSLKYLDQNENRFKKMKTDLE